MRWLQFRFDFGWLSCPRLRGNDGVNAREWICRLRFGVVFGWLSSVGDRFRAFVRIRIYGIKGFSGFLQRAFSQGKRGFGGRNPASLANPINPDSDNLHESHASPSIANRNSPVVHSAPDSSTTPPNLRENSDGDIRASFANLPSAAGFSMSDFSRRIM